MPRTLVFIIFATVLTLIVSSVHYYLWIKLVRDTGISGIYRNISTISTIVLALTIPISLFISRIVSRSFAHPILWFAYLWLGIVMLLFASLISIDILKFIVNVISKLQSSNNKPFDPDRRKFLSGILTYSTSALVLAGVGFGIKNYLSNAIVKRINFTLSGLPKVFNGFKIVQISDLHIGQLMTKDTLSKVVKQVNDLDPDIVVITGDLADGSTKQLANQISPLKNLKSKYGTYFVTGNHEYYNGVEDWIIEIEKLGVTNLHNENIKIEKGNDFFYLAGVTDHEAERYDLKHAANYQKALGNLELDKKIVLLAHQPVQIKEASKFGVDLMLSGHTHGGQVWPFHLFVYLQQPYLKGFYQHEKTKLYVNQGTGCWGPPIRIGSENEITEIILNT